MMRRAILMAVVILMAKVAAGGGQKPRPYIEIRRGQAPEVCAGKADTTHRVPHWHDATFFFDLRGEKPREGDTLVVLVEGHPSTKVTFGSLSEGTYTFIFPAGLGRHHVLVEWDRGAAIVAEAESSLGVYSCEQPSL